MFCLQILYFCWRHENHFILKTVIENVSVDCTNSYVTIIWDRGSSDLSKLEIILH